MTHRKTRSREGWTRVRFGELAELINDRVDDPKAAGVERYVGLEHLDPGSLRISRWGSPDDVTAQKLRFRPGDIIFGKRRAYQRKVAVADFDGICSAHAMVLREREGPVAPGFLAHFMASDIFMERAIQISVGSLSPTINWSALREQEFDLPPVDEQRRITFLMKALTDVTSSFSSALQQAQSLKRAAACDAVDSFARNNPIRPLGDGCLRITDGTHQSPPFTDSGVPFFLVKTISGGNVDWSHTKFVSSETYAELTQRVKPSRGHVLFTAVGATYGVAKFVDFDSPFVFQRHIAHIIPNTSILLGEYIELFLNSPLGKRLSDKHAIGSAQPTVTLRSLASFSLPFPPVAEQTAMVSRIKHLERTAREIANRMHALSFKELPSILGRTQ